MTDAPPFLPMEAKTAEALPTGQGWQFEPKWDGFRCLAVGRGREVKLFAKSGKILHRYFPEVVQNLSAVSEDAFVMDGELVIAWEGGFSFDALQMRLHPAESRIRKLAAEIPATFVAFDLPRLDDRDLMGEPLTVRRNILEAFLAGAHSGVKLSPYTRDRAEAQRWLDNAGGSLDGVIAKRADGGYLPEQRAMLKVKHIRSADCVVGGFRYATGSKLVGSLLLGLYDDEGRLDHVGFTSAFAGVDKPALTAQLEALRGEGFTGNSPGGPSRWSNERTETYEPLRHELVIEVSYDHVSGGRFRHGTTILRWRPDKAPAQCTREQIAPPVTVSGPVVEVLGG